MLKRLTTEIDLYQVFGREATFTAASGRRQNDCVAQLKAEITFAASDHLVFIESLPDFDHFYSVLNGRHHFSATLFS